MDKALNKCKAEYDEINSKTNTGNMSDISNLSSAID